LDISEKYETLLALLEVRRIKNKISYGRISHDIGPSLDLFIDIFTYLELTPYLKDKGQLHKIDLSTAAVDSTYGKSKRWKLMIRVLNDVRIEKKIKFSRLGKMLNLKPTSIERTFKEKHSPSLRTYVLLTQALNVDLILANSSTEYYAK